MPYLPDKDPKARDANMAVAPAPLAPTPRNAVTDLRTMSYEEGRKALQPAGGASEASLEQQIGATEAREATEATVGSGEEKAGTEDAETQAEEREVASDEGAANGSEQDAPQGDDGAEDTSPMTGEQVVGGEVDQEAHGAIQSVQKDGMAQLNAQQGAAPQASATKINAGASNVFQAADASIEQGQNAQAGAPPANLRTVLAAVPVSREEMLDAVMDDYDPVTAQREVGNQVRGLESHGNSAQQEVRNRGNDEAGAIASSLSTQLAAIAATTAVAHEGARAQFHTTRLSIAEGAAAATQSIRSTAVTQKERVASTTQAQLQRLQQDIASRAQGVITRGQRRAAEPTRLINSQIAYVHRQTRKDAQWARQQGALKARQYGSSKPGPEQAYAARSVANETANDVAAKGPGIARKLAGKGGQLSPKHLQASARLAQSVREAYPRLARVIQDRGDAARGALAAGAEAAVKAVQQALQTQLAGVDQVEQRVLANLEIAGTSAALQLQAGAGAGRLAVEQNTRQGEREIQAVATETSHAVQGHEAPLPAGSAAAVAQAKKAMGAIAGHSNEASTNTVFQVSGALGAAANTHALQVATVAGSAGAVVAEMESGSQGGFKGLMASQAEAGQKVVEQASSDQVAVRTQGMKEVDQGVAKAEAEMDAKNKALEGDVKQSVQDSVKKAREPLHSLHGRMARAAQKVGAEYEKPWYKKVASGLWKAIKGIAKGFVILVALALVVAAAMAFLGVALTVFGAMMIAGAILLAVGALMAYSARSKMNPEMGFGTKLRLSLSDTIGFTAAYEAISDRDMATGEKMHGDLEDRIHHGTMGVTGLVMLCFGVRAGFRGHPWVRSSGYPKGFSGVKALGEDVAMGSKETAGRIVDRVTGRGKGSTEAPPPVEEAPRVEEVRQTRSPKVEEAPKVEKAKVEEVQKAEAPKGEEAPKVEKARVEEVQKAEAPKVEKAKVEEVQKAEAPKTEKAPKTEAPRAEEVQKVETSAGKANHEALKTLEEMYPDFEVVDASRNIYKVTVKGQELYGTAEVLMDITAQPKHVMEVGSRLFTEGGKVGDAHVDVSRGLAGTSAQGRVNRFPGDIDFAEQVVVRAPNKSAAAKTLAELVQKTVRDATSTPTESGNPIVFQGMKAGRFPKGHKLAGERITWRQADVERGFIEWEAKGATQRYTLAEAMSEPGNRVVNTEWRAPIDEVGTWGEVTKVMQYEAIDATTGQHLFGTPRIGQAHQEVLLDQPVRWDLKGEALNNALRPQVSYYARSGNMIKALKRAYTVERNAGNMQAAKEIGPLLSTRKAQGRQVAEHLRLFVEDVVRPKGSGARALTREQALSQAERLVVRVEEVDPMVGNQMRTILKESGGDLRGNEALYSQLSRQVARPLEVNVAHDPAFAAQARAILRKYGYDVDPILAPPFVLQED